MNSIKPVLRWVGGKANLVPEIEKRLPEKIDVYYEPFCGGASVFLMADGIPRESYLSDVNAGLIETYQVIRDDVDSLIEELKTYTNTKEEYYRIRQFDRDKVFFDSLTSVNRAARFIFLNKTSFAGLYRENSRGEYNVPYGDIKRSSLVCEDNLRSCSKALSECTLNCIGFYDTLDFIKLKAEKDKNVFVYLDPPYVPHNVASGFTTYNKDGFSEKDQLKLFEYCAKLNEAGVKWMQSNSAAPWILSQYKDFKIDVVSARRSTFVGRTNVTKVDEVLIRNY